MRKIPALLLCFFTTHLYAQAPFYVCDSIDANNINALSLVHGDMWWDGIGATFCQFPNGSTKHIGFASALWLSGYDAGGQLHIAAQTYRQTGNDFWPGPLDASGGGLDYATSQKWAKIWKVTRSDINTFNAIAVHDVSNTPASILSWPGKGNTYARGYAGAPLTIPTEMAPFVDLNHDGIYQPLNGEYPGIIGEQTLWWMFSDNGPSHSQTNGTPLKVEVHAMAYAFKRGTLIDNVVYYDYTVVNKSTDNYHDFRMALWDEVDLGYYMDDYIGYDSSFRLGIGYNAAADDGYIAGHPANSYGPNPPIVGLTLVSLPGDAGTDYVPAGSFMFYNNTLHPTDGVPASAAEHNRYMRSTWRDGSHLKYDPVTHSMMTGTDRNYVFPDDNTVSSGWNECALAINPGDRRFIISSNDFTLNAGSKQRVVMALIVDSSSGGCPTYSFNGIKEVADTAWTVFHNLPSRIPLPETASGDDVRLYPNPAFNKLTIDCDLCRSNVLVEIYDMVGMKVGSVECSRSSKLVLDISGYSPGIYFARYVGMQQSRGIIFAKM